MAYYAAINASPETVNIWIVEGGGCVLLERKVGAEPEAIVRLLRSFGQPLERVGLEAGPTASWLYSELCAAGLPVICLECRHLKAGLGAIHKKTESVCCALDVRLRTRPSLSRIRSPQLMSRSAEISFLL